MCLRKAKPESNSKVLRGKSVDIRVSITESQKKRRQECERLRIQEKRARETVAEKKERQKKIESITKKLVLRKRLKQKVHDSNVILNIMHPLVKSTHPGLEHNGGKRIGPNMLNPLEKQALTLERLGC